MATFVGKDGVIKIGSNLVGELRSYSIEQTMETVETTVMGDADRSFSPSLKGFSGTLECYFDDTNAGQGALKPGDTGVLSVQMEGDTTGDHKLSGNIIVTSRSIGASFDGVTDASITFQGTGALTEGTVS